MNFSQFLNQAWTDHGKEAQAVSDRLSDAFPLLEKNDDIGLLAQLATHVFGEHLGQWKNGIVFLENLKTSPHYQPGSDSEKTIARSQAILSLASGNDSATEGFSSSDQIRVFAVCASALAGQGQTDRACDLFETALQKITEANLDAKDPAVRALAVTGNNLASSLEEKPTRTDLEKGLMLLAAKTAREYWELAGTWLEVERAEYRLALSHIQADLPDQAVIHAKFCIQIADLNDAPPLEFFFGFEALARAEKARGNMEQFKYAFHEMSEEFKLLRTEDQVWCKPSLDRLT